MEKKEYVSPAIEVIELEQEDIIRTSGNFGFIKSDGGVDFTKF